MEIRDAERVKQCPFHFLDIFNPVLIGLYQDASRKLFYIFKTAGSERFNLRFYVLDQPLFEKISVLSLKCDFTVMNQNSIRYHVASVIYKRYQLLIPQILIKRKSRFIDYFGCLLYHSQMIAMPKNGLFCEMVEIFM